MVYALTHDSVSANHPSTSSSSINMIPTIILTNKFITILLKNWWDEEQLYKQKRVI